MEELTADSFQLVSCQASIFTPDGDLAVSKVMKNVYPSLAERFDGDPTVLPPMPEGFPPDIPRIILESKSHAWRCELSSSRVNVHWRRPASAEGSIKLDGFFRKAVEVFLQYASESGPRIGRFAALTKRFAEHKTPALFLSRYFCQDRWMEGPLNRPDNFELHAHKEFALSGNLTVNSWARSKTGTLSGAGDEKPAVLFEQDLNTLADDAPEREFSEPEVKNFFSEAATELDRVLELYYPRS